MARVSKLFLKIVVPLNLIVVSLSIAMEFDCQEDINNHKETSCHLPQWQAGDSAKRWDGTGIGSHVYAVEEIFFSAAGLSDRNLPLGRKFAG